MFFFQVPGSGKLICGFAYYSSIILTRLPTLVLMSVCLGHWFPVFFLVMVLANGGMAFATLR